MSTETQPAETTCYRHADRRAGVRCQRCERPICPSCMSTASVGFHCPECARSGKQKVYTRANLASAGVNRATLTLALIAVNIGVYVIGLPKDDGYGFMLDGGLFGPSVADGEWWRIVTSGFLHDRSPMHALFNMLALFNLGTVLEIAIGRARFAALYAFSLLAGSFGVLLLSPNDLTVGASGAVFGLMGALVIAQRVRGLDPWSSGIGTVIGINLLITFTIPGISIGGHLGGLAGGLLSGWILLDLGPRLKQPPWFPLALVGAIGAAAFAACLVVAQAAA